MDKNEEKIAIPAQFEKASDHGYLRHHIELTEKLESLFERNNANRNYSSPLDAKEQEDQELFHQACEDAARLLLLSDDTITSIRVSKARQLVEDFYNTFRANPELAGASRGRAVH